MLGESETSVPLDLEKGYNAGNAVNVGAGQTLIFGNPYVDLNHRFDALFDDVCVWNHALTAEEVAREYTLRGGMTDPMAALPDPIAHWRFDDAGDIGKDETGRTRLVAFPDAPQNVTPALDGTLAPMGQSLVARASMTTETGGYPENLPTGGSPFTVSLRLMLTSASGEWGTIFYWGDNEKTAGKFFRLAYGGCPRQLYASFKKNTDGDGDLTVRYSDSVRNASHAWIHYTITFNPQSHVMRIYRDGVLEAQNNNALVDIPAAGCFYLNWQPGQTVWPCGVRFDDVRLYDRELMPYEVRTLARSLKTGTVGPVLPSGSDVTVDSGATLAVAGMHVVSNALAGAGDVYLKGGARFAAADWTGFTGRVTGMGELMVAKGRQIPLAAEQVSAPVSFEDSSIVFSADNLHTPLVRTSGRVMLGETGTLALADNLTSFAGKLFKVAACTSYVGPPDTTGWTFESGEPDLFGRFQLVNGMLVLRMGGGGTMFILR